MYGGEESAVVTVDGDGENVVAKRLGLLEYSPPRASMRLQRLPLRLVVERLSDASSSSVQCSLLYTTTCGYVSCVKREQILPDYGYWPIADQSSRWEIVNYGISPIGTDLQQ